MNRETNPNR